jgi:hypothetical protein
MSKNASEQFETQRELARMQRAHHGADSTLDDAEVRFRWIDKWLNFLRVIGPLAITALLSWISPSPGISWLFSCGVVLGAFFLGAWVGGFAAWISGPMANSIDRKIENGVYHATGIALAMLGVAAVSPGVALSGVGIFLFPSWCERFTDRVLGNSDYIRLRRDARQPPLSRIIE